VRRKILSRESGRVASAKEEETMKRMSCLTVLGVLALAAHLLAVGQGRVVGVVSDSSGNPIEGVTLTVTTPSMKSLKISVKTDKTGHYAFIVNDATLRYHMRFEKEGFAPADRDEKFSISEPTTISQKLVKASEAPAARGAVPAPAAASANDLSTKAYNEGVDL